MFAHQNILPASPQTWDEFNNQIVTREVYNSSQTSFESAAIYPDAAIYGQNTVPSPSISQDQYHAYYVPQNGRWQPNLLQPVEMTAAMLNSTEANQQCLWGPCGYPLQDCTPAGLSRHLKEYHFDDVINLWDDRRRGLCQWSAHGHPCGKEMLYEGYGKHIASVHLGSISRICPRCDHKFARMDSLQRHLRQSCRGVSV